jgi:hypothetical protein
MFSFDAVFAPFYHAAVILDNIVTAIPGTVRVVKQNKNTPKYLYNACATK